jgi:ubiquinone/menaquinone biosynthesis C-methylase UbiE
MPAWAAMKKDNNERKRFMNECVCPWWFAYTFDNRIRRIFHNPEHITGLFIKPGMTVMDIGCGMGYFSLGMAGQVGENGRVLAVDLQQQMLDNLLKRAAHAGLADRIIPVKCTADQLGVTEAVDFVLTFWMVHEVPDKQKFLQQVYDSLKPGGKYLLVEPKVHTGAKYFAEMIDACIKTGFTELGTPKVSLSRARVFCK